MPRWIRSIRFFAFALAGSFFESEELMLVDLGEFVDAIGAGRVTGFVSARWMMTQLKAEEPGKLGPQFYARCRPLPQLIKKPVKMRVDC